MEASYTKRHDIQQELDRLTLEESSIDFKLTTLINNRTELSEQLDALTGLSDTVYLSTSESSRMAVEINHVAETAERVANKVKLLDLEQLKVINSINLLKSVQDLKYSLQEITNHIQSQDWESATRVLQRITLIEPWIITSTFTEAVVPTSQLPLQPAQTLANLRESLLDTFLSSFRIASTSGDVTNTNRYFKLFPMIGEEDTGLQVYAEWVSAIVRNKLPILTSKSQSVTHFSTLLTTLFESIALIISQHQPVVEKNYGIGKMTRVIQILVNEADTLGLKVLENWETERKISRKLAERKEYKFTGLNSILKGRAGETVEENKLDVREIDALLVELSLMSGRWQLLRRFLYSRLKDSDDEDEVTTSSPISPLEKLPTAIKRMSSELVVKEEIDEAIPMVEDSQLGLKISKFLSSAFDPMEIWYLRSSIEKAHTLDQSDTSSTPHLSSSLDDIFYILKKTLYRILSTGNIEMIKKMLTEISKILERDVIEIWKAQMEAGFTSVGGTVGRGRDEEDRKLKEGRGTYVVYLNNIDVAAEYIVRLVDEMISGGALGNNLFLDSEMDSGKSSLLTIRATEPRLRSALKIGLDHLFNQLVRPKLRPLLSEVYKDINYILTEDGYADAEYRDDVRKRFIKAWESLLIGYQESFTPSNFNLFFATTVNVLVRPWEGMIRGMKFTELGALRLDRDIRSILSYLSAQSPYASGSIRESFSRLQQIATLLTLDSIEEAEEVFSSLTTSEVSSIMALRV